MLACQFGFHQRQGAFGQTVAELGAAAVQPGHRAAGDEAGGFQGGQCVLDLAAVPCSCRPVPCGTASPGGSSPWSGCRRGRRAMASPRSASSARVAGRSRWRRSLFQIARRSAFGKSAGICRWQDCCDRGMESVAEKNGEGQNGLPHPSTDHSRQWISDRWPWPCRDRCSGGHRPRRTSLRRVCSGTPGHRGSRPGSRAGSRRCPGSSA